MRGQRLKDVTMYKFPMGLLSQLNGLGWPDQQQPTMGLLSQGGGIRNGSPGTGMLIHHFSPDGSPPPDLSNPLAAFDPSAASAGSMLNQGDGTAQQPSATPAMGLLAQQDVNSQSPFGLAVGMRAQQPQEPSQIDLRPDGSPTQSSDLPAPGAANAGPAPLPQAGPMAMFAQPQNQLPQSSLAPADDGEENTPTPAKPTGGILGAQQPQQPQPQQGPAGQPMQLQGATAPQQPEQGGFMNGVGKFVDKLGNIYGQGGPGDALINLGAGLASGKPWGQGVLDASKVTATQNALQAQTGLLAQKQQGQNQTAQYLATKMSIPYEQALGLVQSGAANTLLAQASPKAPQLVDVTNPDGTTTKKWVTPGQADGVSVGAPKDSKDDSQLVDLPDPNNPGQFVKTWVKKGEGSGTQVGGSFAKNPAVAVNLGDKGNATLDKNIVDNIDTSKTKAMGAVGTLQAIARQKAALDGGAITGAGADWRTTARNAVATVLGIDDPAVINSQGFDAAANQKAAEIAKQIASTGHTTNMDLNVGKTIAGADRSKAEQSLRNIIAAQEMLANDTIRRHNDSVDKYSKLNPDAAGRAGWFKVAPGDLSQFSQPATPTAPQNSPKRFKYDATGNLVAQ
jgi:hypothetical protein